MQSLSDFDFPAANFRKTENILGISILWVTIRARWAGSLEPVTSNYLLSVILDVWVCKCHTSSKGRQALRNMRTGAQQTPVEKNNDFKLPRSHIMCQKAGTVCSSTDLDLPTQQVESFLFSKGNHTDLTLSSHYYQLYRYCAFAWAAWHSTKTKHNSRHCREAVSTALLAFIYTLN